METAIKFVIVLIPSALMIFFLLTKFNACMLLVGVPMASVQLLSKNQE